MCRIFIASYFKQRLRLFVLCLTSWFDIYKYTFFVIRYLFESQMINQGMR